MFLTLMMFSLCIDVSRLCFWIIIRICMFLYYFKISCSMPVECLHCMYDLYYYLSIIQPDHQILASVHISTIVTIVIIYVSICISFKKSWVG